MKRLFFFAAATAVALSSCSKDEVTATAADTQNAISFSTYSAVATKTTDVDANALQTSGFYLAGRNSDDSDAAFYTETAVTYSSGVWGFPTTLYWPEDGSSVDFIAHNLASSGLTGFDDTYSGADPTITTTETTAEQVLDLVVAYADGQTRNTNSGTVALTFKHALSQINATVASATTDSDVKLNITKVEFTTIYPAGTCTVSTGPAFDWSTSGNTADISKEITTITELAKGASAASVISNAMVIPQSATTVTAKFYGKFYTGTLNSTEIVYDDFTSVPKQVTLSSTWEANTMYNYAFNITPASLAINFSVTEVSNWGATATPTDGQ